MTPAQIKALPLVKVSSAALKLKQAARSAQAAKPMSKSDFVRQHPNVPASALVELAAKQGLRLSTQLVYVVRGSRSSAPSNASAVSAPKRGPGRPRKVLAVPQTTSAVPAKRGPGRPRKLALTSAIQAPRRGPGRPPKAGHAGLTRSEKDLAALLLAVGLDRAEHVLAGLKQSTRA